jgi:hypothetical protein
MPRVALIQDGTEVARQRYADVSELFRACCEDLSSARGLQFSLHTFVDDSVRLLLNGITPDEFDCMVFASNALLSDKVSDAVANHSRELEQYVRTGGGMLLLHQFRPSLSDVLPEELCPKLVDRGVIEETKAVSDVEVEDDVILHYPNRVLLESLADGKHRLGPSRLYWKALSAGSLPQKLRPILRASSDPSEVLLARSVAGIPERVIVTVVPLDWQGNVELLGNLIRYASLGEPRRFLWLPESARNERTDLFLRWLYADGASAVSSKANPDDMSESWLFKHVDVCIVPPGEFDAVRDLGRIQDFIEHGGTIITARPEGEVGASEVSALVGAYGQRTLARRLYAELAANRDWITLDNAFFLRNIVATLGFFQRIDLDDAEPQLAVRTNDIAHLASAIRARLSMPEHREDLSSSLALGEILCHLVPPPRDDPSLFDWMDQQDATIGADVRLQVRALRALWLGEADVHFLPDAVTCLRERASSYNATLSLAAVVRMVDTLTILDDAGLLNGDVRSFALLAEALDAQIREHPPEPGVGWLSVEATADVTRGLVGLIRQLSEEDQKHRLALAGHVAEGGTILRQAVTRYNEREPSVAWLARLARLIHALVVVDKRFPIGLQRLASLEWPDEGPAKDFAPGPSESLMSDLAVQIKTLRVEEQKLHDQRWAAATGRVSATVLSGSALVLPFALFVWVFSPDSAWDWIANIAVLLPVFIIALGLTFAWLQKRNLLTGWGEALLAVLTKMRPILDAISSVKRKSSE